MVDAAFRGGGLEMGASSVHLSGTQVRLESPSVVHEHLDPVSPFEEVPSFSESVKQTAQSSMFLGSPDELESEWAIDLVQPLDSRPQTDAGSDSIGDGPSKYFDELSVLAGQSIGATEPSEADYAMASDLNPVEPGDFTAPTLDPSIAGASPLNNQCEVPHSIAGDQTAAVPIENQLYGWDYSRDEWPVLVGSSKPTSPKFRATLAVVALLTLAAGFYFLVYQPGSQGQGTGKPTGLSAAEHASAVTEPRASAVTPAAGDAQNQASSPSPDTSATADAKPGQPTAEEAQSRFSLQAAAFPTQAAADEFAEKLKHAGVPSYVVNADLARRGRWFRVRVGRFSTAEDAQMYAREAQLRARSAGVSLQLIVCQY